MRRDLSDAEHERLISTLSLSLLNTLSPDSLADNNVIYIFLFLRHLRSSVQPTVAGESSDLAGPKFLHVPGVSWELVI